MAIKIFASESVVESIFLIEIVTLDSVMITRNLYMIWRKDQIIELFNRICDYRIDDHDVFAKVIGKLNKFIRFAMLYVGTVNVGTTLAISSSFVGAERTLFIPLAFPLDWQHDEVAFWMAYAFFVTQGLLGAISIWFNVMTWNLMAMCSWRYEALGIELITIGREEVVGESKRSILDVKRDRLYKRDLVDKITTYKQLNEYVLSIVFV